MPNPIELAFACLEPAFGAAAVRRQGSTRATVEFQGHYVSIVCTRHTQDEYRSFCLMQVSLPLALRGALSFRCFERANTDYRGNVEVHVGVPEIDQTKIVVGRPAEVIRQAFQNRDLVSFILTQFVSRTLEVSEQSLFVEYVLPNWGEIKAGKKPITPELLRAFVEGLAVAHAAFSTSYESHLLHLQNEGGPAAVRAFLNQARHDVNVEAKRRARGRLIFNLSLGGILLFFLLVTAGILAVVFFATGFLHF